MLGKSIVRFQQGNKKTIQISKLFPQQAIFSKSEFNTGDPQGNITIGRQMNKNILPTKLFRNNQITRIFKVLQQRPKPTLICLKKATN